jgi:hypothetical protein
MIIERTCLYKADLYWYFAHVNENRTGLVRVGFFSVCHPRDASRNGCAIMPSRMLWSRRFVVAQITKVQWCEGMRLVLELDLPWMSLCDELVDCERDGCINFSKFLDRFVLVLFCFVSGFGCTCALSLSLSLPPSFSLSLSLSLFLSFSLSCLSLSLLSLSLSNHV